MAGFPKVVYHPEHGDRLLQTPDEFYALGSGWHESPAFNEPCVVAPPPAPVVVDEVEPQPEPVEPVEPQVEPQPEPVEAIAEDAADTPTPDAPKKAKGRK